MANYSDAPTQQSVVFFYTAIVWWGASLGMHERWACGAGSPEWPSAVGSAVGNDV
jgi:hypothetical protein